MRPELARALKRFLAVVGLLVLFVGALVVATLESDPLLYRKSPIRLIDPSWGDGDSGLCAALEAALSAEGQPVPDPADSFLTAVPIGSLSALEFQERVERVAGWDQLVVYHAYRRGSEVPRDPAITSWWLQRQIDHTEGPLHEGYIRVLVVRDQRSVGELRLAGELQISGVVNRAP